MVSFLESAFLPIPVDAFSLPVMLASRKRLWQAALVASIASVLGGICGYLIGAFLTETLGAWIINAYGLETEFKGFQNQLDSKGPGIIFFGALTPIPYKIVAIAAGVAKYNLAIFIAVSALGRSLRFFGIASTVYLFGPAFMRLTKNHTGLVLATLIIGTAAGFAALFFL